MSSTLTESHIEQIVEEELGDNADNVRVDASDAVFPIHYEGWVSLAIATALQRVMIRIGEEAAGNRTEKV